MNGRISKIRILKQTIDTYTRQFILSEKKFLAANAMGTIIGLMGFVGSIITKVLLSIVFVQPITLILLLESLAMFGWWWVTGLIMYFSARYGLQTRTQHESHSTED